MPKGASTATANTNVHNPPSQLNAARHSKMGVASTCGTANMVAPDVVSAETASK